LWLKLKSLKSTITTKQNTQYWESRSSQSSQSPFLGSKKMGKAHKLSLSSKALSPARLPNCIAPVRLDIRK
jgi:hypothetical protein